MLPSFIKEVRTKCFVGTEAEGPDRGKSPVLFVPGSLGPVEVYQAMAKARPFDYAYYGAGNDRNVREDTYKILRQEFYNNGHRLTVEVNKMPVWLLGMSCTTVSMSPRDLLMASYFKYLDYDRRMIVWVNWRATCYETSFDDPLFTLDKEV